MVDQTILGGATEPGTGFSCRADVIQGACADTFQVLSVLGKGSFGTVYEVAEKKTGHSYAMKVMTKERYFEEDGVRYAMTELHVQSSMSHPFIVALACAFQTVHELVLVMQFCPGGSLQKLVESQGQLPEELSRLYFSELFLAIEHLHSCDIAYRDLKCENSVLDGSGHAMLTDFGLSKMNVTDSARSMRSYVGSLSFGAPEVLASKRYGKAVDVYGLGVVLFEMLTGEPPFFSASAGRKEVVQNIQSAELEIPSSVSGDCASILRALLERDPEQRLGAANSADLRGHPFLALVDFDAVLRKEAPVMPLQPRPPPACTPLPDPFRRGRTMLSILGGTAVDGWEFPAPAPVITKPRRGHRSASCLISAFRGGGARTETSNA